jgi:putative tributyrin esterase
MVLFEVNYFSNALGINTNLNVIIPQRKTNQIDDKDYENYNRDRYPVIYLLHGLGNDESIWMRRTSIERYASKYGFAVVMPTTQLGGYRDNIYGPKYWTFISEELPSFCKEYFANISDKKEDTFVAGASMGGYGAFKLALSRPERFKAAASLSGPLDIMNESNIERFKSKRPFWEGIFGKIEDLGESQNDLVYLADLILQNSEIKREEIPKLYSWCGTEDFLYNCNLEFKEKIKALRIELDANYSKGEHNWTSWDKEIQNVLKFFNELRN